MRRSGSVQSKRVLMAWNISGSTLAVSINQATPSLQRLLTLCFAGTEELMDFSLSSNMESMGYVDWAVNSIVLFVDLVLMADNIEFVDSTKVT
jgi:hypothetical protein